MQRELSKVYDPHEVEERIYAQWDSANCFRGVRDKKKKSFTIVMPPPNVTGQLHMGHAMDCTLQDILIRWKRMQGYASLWIPGTDHAGIATQIKVEETLREEGISRYDLGRDAFLDRVWEWKDKYGNRIVEQQKKMGASCDWKRSHFTMDEGYSKAVREVFVSLYEKELIYKGSRIINWCPQCTTALSDAEVEYQEKAGHLWHVKYPIKGKPGQYVTVATSRPETMLGDSGIAVNPNDSRYQDLIGETCILPLMNREIPIVADEYVDMEFGTGCVKMTPAHDPNDFEVGLRHNLESIRVLDDSGKVNELGGPYEGLDRYEARKAIVADLTKLELIESIVEHPHNVGTCYRCGTDVEPIISAQWFVKMAPLAKEAIHVVEAGETKFIPDRFSKTYLNWMENVHDWCISRQLWWGHQIPAWYCADCGHITVSREDPSECEACKDCHLERDPDVLDTWFSSALWPFATLGWPEKTEDLDFFYPTDVLVTGYDIIFFWVARMIFSGCEHTGQTPFHTVFIHGLVRDDKGRKMSKSLGNGIDPLEMAERYGADALRFTLVSGNSPGNDLRFYTERCEAMRNFANKVWNASRFLMMNLSIRDNHLPETLELEDRWILSKLNALIPDITDNMDHFELGVAAGKLYDFIWDTYCDWYIEMTKTHLQGEDPESKENAQRVLSYVLTELLKLLHPFMPFITEEIWQALPHEGAFLMTESFPVFRPELSFPEEEKAIETVMEAIQAVRSRRSDMNVPPSKRARLLIKTSQPEAFRMGEAILKRLAYGSDVLITDDASPSIDTKGMVTVTTYAAQIMMPLSELVDLEKERARLEKEIVKNQAEQEKIGKKLDNPGFLSKAPASVVATERERYDKLSILIQKLQEQRNTL